MRAPPQGPGGRDAFADLLRVLAIHVVVLGHWLVPVIRLEDGRIEVARVTAILPATAALTWLFQVMPVFFMVGGYVNALSWSRARERGDAWATWVSRRAARLLAPLAPLLAGWLLAIPLVAIGGVPREHLALASASAFVPVWFLAAYLAVIALVPLTLRLHARLGAGGIAAFLAATALLDAARRAGAPDLTPAHVAIVWTGVHQLGYFWHDALRGESPALGAGLAASAIGALLLLVLAFGYPVGMVDVGGGAATNANPPNLALFALALAQLGVLLAARPLARRWLAQPRARAFLAVAGRNILTIYLWHVTALVLVAGLLVPTRIWPAVGTVDAAWWALRIPWIALCALALAGLVLLFGRFEHRSAPRPVRSAVRVALGLLASVAGLAALAQGGPYDPSGPAGIALPGVAATLGGMIALGALGAHARKRPG